MTKDEQIDFVQGLSETVVSAIIERIERGDIPESWDGVELRWLLKDNFDSVVWDTYKGNSKRKRDYKNTVLVNNL